MKILEEMRAALAAQSPLIDEAVPEILEPSPISHTQTAFDLNAGHNSTAPVVRHTLYKVGTIVTVKSPLFGRFKAEVLRDNGVIVWVLHPFIEREVAIPNEWLLAEGGTRSDCPRGLDHQQCG